MSTPLYKQSPLACKKGTSPYTQTQVNTLLNQLSENWTLNQKKHLINRFEFKNFTTALDFINLITPIAEHMNHHPIITFSWGYVEITIYTHHINGLHHADFVLAAKISQYYNQLSI